MIEVTDVVFAVDSVPAILAVSREPFIVFASNAFAILGLRAMYFLLGDARERFHYLSHALGAILVFVGVKMAVSHWWHIPTMASLAVIIAILVAAIVFSVRKRRAEMPSPPQRPRPQPRTTDVVQDPQPTQLRCIGPAADALQFRRPTSVRRCRARWAAASL